MKASSVLPVVVTLVVFMCSAVALTWPLALRLDEVVETGGLEFSTVSYAQAWSLDHILGAMSAGDYWHAPIFHPTEGTFALSEASPVSAVLAGVLGLAMDGPIAPYNVVVLLALALNGAAACWLLRRLGVDWAPAVLTGLLVQLLPTLHWNLGVLPLLYLWPWLLVLGALVGWAERPSLARGAALGGTLGLTYLCCQHYGLLAGVVAVPTVLMLLRRRHLGLKALASLGAAVAVAVALVAPLATGQARWLDDFSRGSAEVAFRSARPGMLLNAARDSWLLPPFVGVAPILPLFPGVVRGVLAAFGAWVGSGELDLGSEDAAQDRDRRLERGSVVLIVSFAVLFAISFAPSLAVSGLSLYDLLVAVIPGFEKVRSLSRAALLAQLQLTLLAGVGAGIAWRWVGRFGGRGRLAWGVLGVLAIIELPTPDGTLRAVSDELQQPTWSLWIGENTPEDSVLVYFPDPATPMPHDWEPLAELMLLGRWHGRSQVGGYSSFFPESYTQVRRRLKTFPARDAVQAAAELGATHAVVDLREVEVTEPETLGLVEVHRNRHRAIGVFALVD